MTALLRLLDDFQARRLTLPGLFDALVARGAATADEHRAELAQLEVMAADGRLDPAIAKAVAARLRTLQAPVDDEVARAQVEAPAADLPHDVEVTRVEPASRPAGSSAGDVTRVAPVATSPPDASAGVATGTHPTASIGSFSRTDLERMVAADAEVAAVGMLLKGRFLLEREIGRGGMGVVYLARDERKVEARDRDPYVAVKVLNDEFRRHPDSLIALQRESRRAQLLAHDNILRVYDFDKDRTIVFMTMEYIDGTDLRTLIRERVYHGLPLAEARPLIAGMAHALQRAHAAGIVHSDFKPGNVMVTREGVAKVFDFGIARAAKRLGEATGEETVFDAGTLGALTPAYASLEMTQGKEPSPSDDIYALGCVAFELLTGKHPFDKVSAEVALKEGRKPPPVPGLTRRQYKVLCDSVAFHAGQRPKSVEALVEGLRDIRLRERAGRPLAYALAGILLLLAAGWFALGQWHARQMAEVVAGFQPGDAHRYADETQAFAALAGLGEDGRRQLMLAHGDVVQSYLLERVDAYWNPARGGTITPRPAGSSPCPRSCTCSCRSWSSDASRWTRKSTTWTSRSRSRSRQAHRPRRWSRPRLRRRQPRSRNAPPATPARRGCARWWRSCCGRASRTTRNRSIPRRLPTRRPRCRSLPGIRGPGNCCNAPSRRSSGR
jgi:Serine/threonine protein kinase